MKWYEIQGLNTIKKDVISGEGTLFDYGHGGIEPGCTLVNKSSEKDYVLKFGKAVYDICSKYIKISQTRTKDITLGSKARTNLISKEAKKYKILNGYSFHLNAYNKKSNGTEILISITQKTNSNDYIWASKFLNYYCKEFGLHNRGIVQRKGNNGDYYYLMRDTPSNCKMKIIELWFGDNESDFKKCYNSNYFDKAAFFVASYILKRHGIEIEKPKEDYLYKVQAGAFEDLRNAENLSRLLRKYGFDSIIKKEKE